MRFKFSHKNIFILGLLVYIITSYFSIGYHHPDEHFQIFEFCNYKLGNSSFTDLAWEYNAQARQTLPVFIAYIIITFLYFIKITNPFFIAFIFRLLTAFAAWFIIRKLCLILLDNFKTEKGKKLFVAMSMLLWFVPYIIVRFSSENLSGITFLYAIYLLLKLSDWSSYKKITALAGIGLLLGFTFYFRFQMGFAIVGLGLWLLFINKMNWKNLLLIIFAGCISVLICICIDYWFYGNWVLSPVTYFNYTIVQGVAASFGVTPWYNYFVFFILQSVPPLGLMLLAFFLIGLYKKPTSIFLWCLIPFLIAHFAVGHKEMRFMFPVVFGFIYIVAAGIDHFISTGKYKKLGRILFIIAIIINVPFLVGRMFMPAQETVCYYKFLFDYSQSKKMILLCNNRDFYRSAGPVVNFYRSPNVKCIVIHGDKEITNYLNEHKPDSVFLFDEDISAEHKIAGYKNESLYCLFPQWILHFNINNWVSRSRIWNIQKLKKIKDS